MQSFHIFCSECETFAVPHGSNKNYTYVASNRNYSITSMQLILSQTQTCLYLNRHSPFTWNIEKSFPNLHSAFKQLSNFNKYTIMNKLPRDYHTKQRKNTWNNKIKTCQNICRGTRNVVQDRSKTTSQEYAYISQNTLKAPNGLMEKSWVRLTTTTQMTEDTQIISRGECFWRS